MQAIANFVMKGRLQAGVVVLVCSILPLLFWISAAVVGLITMRRGINEGAILLIAAIVPSVIWAQSVQDPTSLFVIATTWGMAVVLRQTVSWEKALFVGAGLAVLSIVLLPIVSADLLNQLVAFGVELFRQLNPERIQELGENVDSVVRNMMIGSLAVSYAMFATMSLMLARAWQAKLFNPGGFRKEFHQFRLSRASATLSVISVLVLSSLGDQNAVFAFALLIPLGFAGLALIHGSVARKNLSKGWLVWFYVISLIIGPSLIVLLVLLAVMDSWIDVRSRIRVD
ncbi:membrane protein [Oleiphilus messinensis]|uniref:Membrane protein n=1 Tax=Oleiphilus messinensis TaxID=141451 RepID=A0A1Y0I6K7_9GAMM|nr:DUF2232 domain-containing protein [Oleiphilus messinensis]ARU55165.1 membrane protein [Oleiphilus messinensis]